MKKLVAFLLAASVAMVGFAGCSQASEDESKASSPTNSEESSDEGTDETASIVWGGWSGEEEAAKDIFNMMMDEYETTTGNEVTWVGWTWADTAQQLLIRTQGSEQLDIAQVDIGMFNTLAAAGVLADLNEVLGEDYLTENFEASALEVGQVDGKQLAMPWSMAAITMVYNPELLASAGWDEPPVTMDEFEQCLADIKAMDSSIIPYGVSTKDATAAGDLMPWLWTFGAYVFDDAGNVTIDSEQAVATIEWYQDMLDKGYIAMDTGRGDARQLFAQGKIAFYDDAVVAKGQVVNNGVDPDDVSNVCSAMARPVLNEGDAPQSTMWGHMLVIFDKSEFKAQAAELAKVLVSDDVAMEYFTNNGMPPVTKSLASSEEVQNDPYINGFIESTKTASLEETARMINASAVKTILTEELQAALLGQKDAAQAIADMQARLEAI